MGEILIGILVMAGFIGFVIWKNKGKEQKQETLDDLHREQWWADREDERKQGPVIVSADSRNDKDDKDDDD